MNGMQGAMGDFCASITKNRLPKKAVYIHRNLSFGGDKRDRTADLLNAIQALSQLSYTPRWVTIIY